jgi:hypothetical protein
MDYETVVRASLAGTLILVTITLAIMFADWWRRGRSSHWVTVAQIDGIVYQQHKTRPEWRRWYPTFSGYRVRIDWIKGRTDKL